MNEHPNYNAVWLQQNVMDLKVSARLTYAYRRKHLTLKHFQTHHILVEPNGVAVGVLVDETWLNGA